jgi:hypothetical protein
MTSGYDKELGIDRAITRRDFIYGSCLTVRTSTGEGRRAIEILVELHF